MQQYERVEIYVESSLKKALKQRASCSQTSLSGYVRMLIVADRVMTTPGLLANSESAPTKQLLTRLEKLVQVAWTLRGDFESQTVQDETAWDRLFLLCYELLELCDSLALGTEEVSLQESSGTKNHNTCESQ